MPNLLIQEEISPNKLAIALYQLKSWDGMMNGHCLRVSQYAKAIAQHMKMSQYLIKEIEVFGIIHDIGKWMIPEAIINKPNALLPEEWEIMKTHTTLGGKILERIPSLKRFSRFVTLHHEYWNGSGYPFGLSGFQIPLEVRILAVADAFDAMTSARPYQSTKTVAETICELQRYAGKQFWTPAVEAFTELIEQKATIFKKGI